MDKIQPLNYLISRVKTHAKKEPTYISHFSYPQWVECFWIYKTSESGMRDIEIDWKKSVEKIWDAYVSHVILMKWIQERIYSLCSEKIMVPRGDITLHDEKFWYLWDYCFIWEQWWVASATEQYKEEKHQSWFYRENWGPQSYHIGLNGKAIYHHRFKHVWDYIWVWNNERIPYREIHWWNYNYFEGAFPIGIQWTGSPLSTKPLLYMIQKHTSYRARAITLDNKDVWIDEYGEILSYKAP